MTHQELLYQITTHQSNLISFGKQQDGNKSPINQTLSSRACLPGDPREDEYLQIEVEDHEVISHKKCYGPSCMTLSCVPFVFHQQILIG